MATEKTTTLADIFGEYVFSDAVMKKRLSKAAYKSLKNTIDEGAPFDLSIADEVAAAMKEWAIELGATHFTHWFMPMTGIMAEKHDSFISPVGDGTVLLSFSGKELMRGEPDASSFPSGGLRETAAARGYTAWDCTSPAFVKDGTLYIPTAFFSYTGEILDKKAPLLRSTQALSKQALRVLKALGNSSARKVTTTVGPEQEYFIVDRELYNKRLDLIITGRTLFGARPPKGQELDDQYFAKIRARVVDFMHDLDTTLWKLGITAKTKHNEVAPGQHELALIFDPATAAADHNELVMELMEKIAQKHGLAALLHEKPFVGVNGSGKHINWSMATDEGENLLDPGENPAQNTRFLTFLSAVVKAVDEYADLLRLSVASAGNDHRLGANEAPPAIVSMFVGEELDAVIDAIESGKPYTGKKRVKTNLGVASLPVITEDATDRNRTSPFAFTGNKFEFRMCGSSSNIAEPCFTLNTVVAHELKEIADKLETAADAKAEALALIKEILKAHRRVIFNGNNYAPEWVEEAARRGLPNIGNTVEAVKVLKDKKNKSVFAEQGVLVGKEVDSRYEILLDNYAKTINIEAQTMTDMVNRQLLPASLKFASKLAAAVSSLKAAGVSSARAESLLKETVTLADTLGGKTETLAAEAEAAGKLESLAGAAAYREKVVPALDRVSDILGKLEAIVPADIWPVPTYADLLFRV